MKRAYIPSLVAVAIGVVLLLINIASNGLGLSLVLLLGLLFIADGVIRWSLADIEAEARPAKEPTKAEGG